MISNIRVGDEASRAKDVLGRVYEYFLEKFALAEGRKGGEFLTPHSVVNLLVENVTIDWTLRENVRALVKRILRKHGYPPDKQEKATKTVLQAALLSAEWAGA